MEIKVQRYLDNGNATQGLLFIDGKFECYTLEDEYREVKVKGETRIPAGRYEITTNKPFGITPLTAKYRKKFGWFTWHLMLNGVLNFFGIYIHIGNHEGNTDGCLLVADNANNGRYSRAFNRDSTKAFKRLYGKIMAALDAGEKVFITICDEIEIA